MYLILQPRYAGAPAFGTQTINIEAGVLQWESCCTYFWSQSRGSARSDNTLTIITGPAKVN